jgi:hypothetical protein
MLITAVPSTFIQILEHQLFRYSQLSPLQILTHLDTTYGEVTFEDLANNLEQMNRPWDPSLPIKALWSQIQKTKNYAAADHPITDTTAILSATQNLTNSRFFHTAYDQWRIKSKAKQTSWSTSTKPTSTGYMQR